MNFVLDASFTLAYLLPDEVAPGGKALWRRVESGYAWAPPLWRLEVVNSLQYAVRRGRATPQFRNDTLADLKALPIRFDSETDSHVWGTTLELAIQHGLMPHIWNWRSGGGWSLRRWIGS